METELCVWKNVMAKFLPGSKCCFRRTICLYFLLTHSKNIVWVKGNKEFLCKLKIAAGNNAYTCICIFKIGFNSVQKHIH